jgi:hypothetical protein
MKRENLSGSFSRDIRPRQSACTTNYWLFTLTLYTLALRFDHLQSYGAKALFTAVTVLICACTKAPSLQNHFHETDSLTIHINSSRPYGHLDLFVYSDTLTQDLETHLRINRENTLRINTSHGGKFIVAMADLPGVFSYENIPKNFAVMEHLSMNYADENPEAPFQSGYCHSYTGERAELSITPLLCRIIIKSICLEGNAPLKNPVIQLANVNESGLILQSDGFYPSSVLSGPEGLKYPFMIMRELPFDIGSKPIRTGISLWCYPNEYEGGPGRTGTSITVSGTINGVFHQFYIPLGSVHRSDIVEKEIVLK